MNEKAKIKGLNIFFQQNPGKKNLSIVNVISMEQPSQTGTKFKAFIECLNVIHQKYGVKKIVIILTDFLQRHYVALNEELSFSNEELGFSEVSKLSNEKGNAWIKENGEVLINCLDKKIKFNIIRWQKLLAQDDFSEAFNRVEKLYQKDGTFKSIVDTLSQHHAEKLVLRSANFKKPYNFKNCSEAAKSYLLEESAIWAPLLNLGLDFITYPGGKNEAVDYTYTELFQSKNCSLPWFRYSFEKRTSNSLCSGTLIEKYKSLTILSGLQFSISHEKVESFNPKEFNLDRRHSL